MLLEERPRERLVEQGAEALRSAELLAILLRTGTKGCSAIRIGEELLQRFGTLEGLSRAEVAELASLHGVGKAKAVQIKAAFALGLRLQKSQTASLAIRIPTDVVSLLGEEMRQLPYESLRIIVLNTKHAVITVQEVSRGLLNESLFHPREAFHPAIVHRGYGVILVHNHPSGDPTPSGADIQVTRQMKEAGELLQIPLIDHVILGTKSERYADGCYSFKEYGRLG